MQLQTWRIVTSPGLSAKKPGSVAGCTVFDGDIDYPTFTLPYLPAVRQTPITEVTAWAQCATPTELKIIIIIIIVLV